MTEDAVQIILRALGDPRVSHRQFRTLVAICARYDAGERVFSHSDIAKAIAGNRPGVTLAVQALAKLGYIRTHALGSGLPLAYEPVI